MSDLTHQIYLFVKDTNTIEIPMDDDMIFASCHDQFHGDCVLSPSDIFCNHSLSLAGARRW